MADAAVPGRRPPPPPPPPARVAPRRRGARVVALAVPPSAGFLVVAGYTFVGIGVVDVGTAESLASTIFGGILLLVGGGLVATAYGLWRKRPWTGTAGVAPLAVAAAIALYLSLNAWEEEPRWGAALAVLAAGCVVAGAVVVAVCRPRFGVKSASILSVAGFALGFFQFTYTQSARVRVGSTLTMSTDLTPAGGEPVKAVAATVKAVNPTTAKIQSLGSLYVVEGVRQCRRSRHQDPHDQFVQVFADAGAESAFAPRVAEDRVVTIQAGKLFEDRTYFEPGEEIVRRFSVRIPKSKYDVVRLRVTLALANGDRLQLDEVIDGPAPADGARGVEVVYGVSEGSLVDRITHADRVVEVMWESGARRVAPALWASARLAQGDGAATDRSTSYGVAYTRSSTELPLERKPREAPSRKGAAERAALWPPPRPVGGEIELPSPPPTQGPGATPPTPAPAPPPTPTPRISTVSPPTGPPDGAVPPMLRPEAQGVQAAPPPPKPEGRDRGGTKRNDRSGSRVQDSCRGPR